MPKSRPMQRRGGATAADKSTRLLAAKIDLLARQVPTLAVGTMVLASGAAYLLIHQRLPAERVLMWLGLVLALTLVRVAAYWRYKRTPATRSVRGWALLLCSLSFAAGVLWGLLGVLFFVPEDPFTIAVVAIVISAILASALNSLGPFWPAHLVFGIPAALPFALACLTSGQHSMVVLGWLALCFMVFAETYARAIARSIEHSLLLRFENLELLHEVTAAKERAEAAGVAKTRLLAAVSHDLRQPLHGVGLLAGVVEDAVRDLLAPGDAQAGSEIVGLVQRIHQDCEEMSQLVGRLLDASHLQSGHIDAQPQPCDVSALVSSVAASAMEHAHAKGLRMRVNIRGRLPMVNIDPVLLQSVLANLVSNAVKYTNSGGVLIACRKRAGRLRVEVWDTGIGIPADEVDLVLGEYYQARNAAQATNAARGFGLGLSIVSRLAALLGLRLEVRSRLGRGSVFVVELPG